MLSRIFSACAVGLEGTLIEVEVDVASRGFPTFTIVGLPAKSIDEAKDRVRTAIVNTDFQMPDSKITVNLAPADIPKEGSSFDLPIALGILSSSGVIDKNSTSKSLFVGELSLEGQIRKVPGAISTAIVARNKKITNLFVPAQNAKEVSLVDGIDIYPISSIADLILHLNGQKKITKYKRNFTEKNREVSYGFDFADIRGQEPAKRAMQIAAAGFHNIHLKGPPGAGKTMLSRAFPSILPPLSKDEILEVSMIHNRFEPVRPFRSPHHTTSQIGLIGGGSTPTAGEITLAHRGVLFLDEFPEFPRHVLEALRTPLEDGIVTISRAKGSLSFPSRFILVAASNPCPCGYLGHPKKSCKCMPGAILKYRKRLSGPILDRIDLHVDVPPVDEEKLVSNISSESSKQIQERIISSHKKQKKRFKGTQIATNSQMSPKDIKKFCVLTDEATALLKQAISRLSLSARSYFKIIKIATTIADIENASKIEASHIAESLQYRVNEE
jgi:magnesium chelatase family protein